MVSTIQQDIEYGIILDRIKKQFPDIGYYQGRWTKFLCSPSVNKLCDNYELAYSCGCCDDAALYVRPYIIIENIKVYSDPPQICIGKTDRHAYDILNYEWPNILLEHNIPHQIIDKIKYWDENENEQNRQLNFGV